MPRQTSPSQNPPRKTPLRPAPPRPTRAEAERKAQYHYLAGVLKDLDAHLRHGLEHSDAIPEEWARIAAAPPEPRKVKLTLRVDEDVLRFFRVMGVGYLTRMNAVLRAFMHARLAGVVGGAEAVAYAPTRYETYVRLAAEGLEKLVRRNSRARQGRSVEDADVELHNLMVRITELHEELDLPEAEWLVPKEALDAYWGKPGEKGDLSGDDLAGQ